jgi:hypothetical protein
VLRLGSEQLLELLHGHGLGQMLVEAGGERAHTLFIAAPSGERFGGGVERSDAINRYR